MTNFNTWNSTNSTSSTSNDCRKVKVLLFGPPANNDDDVSVTQSVKSSFEKISTKGMDRNGQSLDESEAGVDGNSNTCSATLATSCAAECLIRKLKSLHSSKAGPFHIAFVLGCSSSTKGQSRLLDCLVRHADGLPIPVYVQDTSAQAIPKVTLTAHTTPTTNTTNTTNSCNNEESGDSLSALSSLPSSPCLKVANNVHLLRDAQPNTQQNLPRQDANDARAGIWDIPIPALAPLSLVVASCPPRFCVDNLPSSSALLHTVSHPSYVGCDLLLTSEWPQGIDRLLQSAKSVSSTSFDVADVALKVRARYHVAPSPSSSTSCTSSSTRPSSQQIFHQTTAFQHLGSVTSTNHNEVGRFLALCSVPNVAFTAPANQDKNRKYVHALGIVPFARMTASERIAATANLAPCPYTDESYDNHSTGPTGSIPNTAASVSSVTSTIPATPLTSLTAVTPTKNLGLSDAAARRILSEEQHRQRHQPTGKMGDRWGLVNTATSSSTSGKRKQPEDNDISDHDTSKSTTLFVHGLHKDVTGRLQNPSNSGSDERILQALGHGALRVRRPNATATSSFCFVEFQSHEDAAQCLERHQNHVVTVDGIELLLKWGRGTATTTTISKNISNRDNVHNPSFHSTVIATGAANASAKRRRRLTEREARDSHTIYFKYAWSSSSVSSSLLQQSFQLELLGGILRQYMEQTLERALAGETQDDETKPNNENKSNQTDPVITAQTEPALRVTLRLPSLSPLAPSNTNGEDPLDDKKNNPTKTYGFLDFASHAAASLALATLTGSTDGGLLLDSIKESLSKLSLSVNLNDVIVCEDGCGGKNQDENLNNQTHQKSTIPTTTAMSTASLITSEEKHDEIQKKSEIPTATKTSPEITEAIAIGKPFDGVEAINTFNSVEAVSLVTEKTIADYLKFGQVYLHWAEKPTTRPNNNFSDDFRRNDEDHNVIIDVVSGFRFYRQHFPRDSRTDCWFCLASSSCEKHLITGVYNHCYSTMPKGPIHAGHILLVPVHHTDQGVFWKNSNMNNNTNNETENIDNPIVNSNDVCEEMESLKTIMRRHAMLNYNSELFVFERAFPTKGGYHTHVQCIPVPRGLGRTIESTMLLQAKRSGMDLREVCTDIDIATILATTKTSSTPHDDSIEYKSGVASSDDNDSDKSPARKNVTEGYFYAEVPIRGMEYKRFLYQKISSPNNESHGNTTLHRHITPSHGTGVVPMQFGREVLAAVLGKPELAHWKSCVIHDPQQESAMAISLRESLADTASTTVI